MSATFKTHNEETCWQIQVSHTLLAAYKSSYLLTPASLATIMALITYFIASVVILFAEAHPSIFQTKISSDSRSKVFVLLRTELEYDVGASEPFLQAVRTGLETLESEGKINVDNIEAVNLNGAMTAKLSITIDDEVACNEVEAFAKKAIKANSELHSAFITCRGEKGKRLLRGKH